MSGSAAIIARASAGRLVVSTRYSSSSRSSRAIKISGSSSTARIVPRKVDVVALFVMPAVMRPASEC